MKIFINGEEFKVGTKHSGEAMNYESIISLAGKEGNQTVTFRGEKSGDGILHAGKNIEIEEGMRFDVVIKEDELVKTIWWDINKGDDKRNGLSPEEAVKTQARVSDLLGISVDIKQSKTGRLAICPGRDIKFEKI